MKRLSIWVLVLLSGLLTLQAQESELRPPRIFGLACANNQLSSLDVSGLTSLEYLACANNQLSSLDVSGLTSLEYLDCANNQLSNLDVSGCIALKELAGVTADTIKIHGMSMDTLDASGSYHIKVLDAKGCPSLTSLYCRRNGLTALDVSDCTALTSLSCGGNQLSNLDVSGLTSLERLYCEDNQLSSLDVSGCTSLKSLDCYRNQLSSLDVSGCTSLKSLNCYRNQLSSLDVSGLTSLEGLYCTDNQLSNLDVSGCIALKELTGVTADTLKIHGMSMDTLDLSVDDRSYCHINVLDAKGCPSLTSLDCGRNGLTALDVSGCTALTSLSCGSNQLSNLDVSGLTSLESLSCGSNQLSNLDVSKNTDLTSLDCRDNQLSSLDVSKHTDLTSLSCGYNRIPLSMLYKIYSQRPNWNTFSAEVQSDSIMLLIDRPWDLSPERIIGQTLSTFTLTDAYGGEVSSDFVTENKFVFQFHEPIGYTLKLENKAVGSEGAAFTWHVSVVEEMPVQYFNVQVVSNNTEWGTATITGSGTYEEGSEVTITAKANTGYRFVNWTEKDGTVFTTEAIHTFTVTEDVVLTANFEKKPDVANESREDDNFYVYAQDHTIHLSAERGLVQVYNATGVCVYSGHATAIPVKSGGLYIVRVGERAYKAIVR